MTAIRYLWAFLRLVVKAGTVWGIRPDGDLDDWADAVFASTLKYELIALERMRPSWDRRTFRCLDASDPK